MKLYYVGLRDNKYGTNVHSCINILKNPKSTEQEIQSSFDCVFITESPTREESETTINIDVNVADIPVENIQSGQVVGNEVTDPMTEETFTQDVSVIMNVNGDEAVVTIPNGTTIPDGATTISVPYTYIDVDYVQYGNAHFADDIRGFPNNFVLDESGGSVVARQKTNAEQVEDNKVAKLQEIKDLYEQELKAGYLVSGLGSHPDFRVDCEQKDISNWTSALEDVSLKADLGTPMTDMTVGTYDNNTVTLSISEFKQMCSDVADYYRQQFSKKWQLRENVKNATTQSELDQIVW